MVDQATGQRVEAIAKSIKEAKHWDKMTKRQEPITTPRLTNDLAQPPDSSSHERALIDWPITGLTTGYRGI
jgi:hypothetical protein